MIRITSLALVLAVALSAAAAEPVWPTTSVQFPEFKGGKYKGLTNAQMLEKIVEAVPAQPIAPPQKPRKLLVFTLCTGYVHPAIPHVSATLELMGKKTGAYTAVVSDDPGYFEPEKLAQFDAVAMNNTCNASVFLNADDLQRLKAKDAAVQEKWERLKKSFSEFVRGGKGLVGFHGAADCGGMWPEYVQTIGGHFGGHPWNANVVCRIESPEHAINKASGASGDSIEIADEIYIFRDTNPRTTHRILWTLDMERCAGLHKDAAKWAPERGRPDGDNPMIWIKRHGEGRVYYSAFGGHAFELCWNPVMLRHWLAGIQYALGDFKADDSPSGEASRPKLPSDAQIAHIAAAAPAKAAKPRKARKLLAIVGDETVPNRFVLAAVSQLGRKTGAFALETNTDPTALSAETLGGFDGFCLIGPGALGVRNKRLDKEQTAKLDETRRSLIRLVEEGRGLVALGGAGEAARNWPELAQLLGATTLWAPWNKAVLRAESPDHPISVAGECPAGFEISDRVHLLGDPYSRQAVRVLLSVDVQKSGIAGDKNKDKTRPDGDHAISWAKTAGKGRVYCNTLGSQSATAANPVVLRHWLAGIQYALGD